MLPSVQEPPSSAYLRRAPLSERFPLGHELEELLRTRARARPLRVWLPGCGRGEELRSIASFLKEEGLLKNALLLGTDSSVSLLKKAREVDSLWPEAESGRSLCFEYLNMTQDAYPSLLTRAWGMDIIFCQGIFSRLDARAIGPAAQRMACCLSEGGWLLVGNPDSLAEIPAPGLERAEGPWGACYRRRSRREPAGGVSGMPARERALRFFTEGDYELALSSAEGMEQDSEIQAVRLKALAYLFGPAQAELSAARSVELHPRSTELHLLRSLLRMELGFLEGAADSARRCLYLDGSLAVAHFCLAMILRLRADLEGARRAFRNARNLCGRRPPEEPLPLGDGARAGRLAEAAKAQLELLSEPQGAV